MINKLKQKSLNRHQIIIKIVGFILVVLVAMFFRGYNLEHRIYWWNGDSSRDILMARHIAFLGDRPATGPNIAGGFGYLNNSPLYYYMLALVYRVWDNVLTIPYFLVIVDSLAIGIGYWLLFEFGGLLAFIFGLSLAVNSFLSWTTQLIIQPVYLPMITFLAIYFWYKSSKSSKLLYFLLYISFCTLSLHVYYAELTMFPVLGLAGLWIYKKNKYYQKNWWIPLLWLGGCLLIWIELTYKGKMFDQIQALGLFQKNNFTLKQLLINSSEIHLMVLKNLFNITNNVIVTIIWGIIYLFGGLVAWFNRNKKPFYLYIYCLFVSINLNVFMGGYLAVYSLYISQYYIIVLTLIFLLLQKIDKKKIGHILSLILGILILVRSFGYSDISKFVGGLRYNNRNIDNARHLSNLIIADSVKNDVASYDVVFYDMFTNLDNFGGSILWYFLEKTTDKKLVMVVDDTVGGAAHFMPINKINQVIYFICSNVISDGNWKEFEYCEYPYLKMKKEQGIHFEKEVIEINKEGEVKYRLLKLKEIFL